MGNMLNAIAAGKLGVGRCMQRQSRAIRELTAGGGITSSWPFESSSTYRSRLPFFYVFLNHDADMVSQLNDASKEYGGTCIGWGGEISLGDKRIAIAHGHSPKDFRPLLAENPSYFLFGHTHMSHESMDGGIRRINPGALFRADKFSVALLDLVSNELEFIPISRDCDE